MASAGSSGIAAPAVGQHRRILDRHRGALGEERQHRVGGVPEQRDRAVAPVAAAAAGRTAPISASAPAAPGIRAPARTSSTARNARAARRGRRPRSSPARTSVSSTMATMLMSCAALHRIVHQMRVPCRARAARRARGIPASTDRRPAPAHARRCAAELRLAAVAEPRPQARPQPVGADQRDAVLVGGDGGRAGRRR